MEMIFTYNNYKNSIAILSGYQAKRMVFSPGTVPSQQAHLPGGVLWFRPPCVSLSPGHLMLCPGALELLQGQVWVANGEQQMKASKCDLNGPESKTSVKGF